MRLAALAAATALLTIFTAAEAQTPDNRFYVSVHAGQDRQDDETIIGANVANLPRELDLSFNDGRVYAGAIGIKAMEGDWGRVRFDAELSQREADLDTLFLNGVQQTVRQGSHVLMTAAMLNAYYDTPVYFDRLRFFAGAGAGIANIDHQVRYRITGGANPSNVNIAIPTAEPTWAYQLVGGAEVILSPNWSLLTDVRLVEFGDVQVQRFNFTAGTLDSVLDADKSTVSLTAGLRYSF